MKSGLMFIHAMSPLHAGTGESFGAVDLAIAREKATGMPFVPGSSLKGVLRDRHNEAKGEAETIKLFGPPPREDGGHAGSLHFGDARLVAMPVRSVAGTFAYVTSPYLLARLADDAKLCGVDLKFPKEGPANSKECWVADDSALVMQLGGQNKVVFEDLDFDVVKQNQLSELAKGLKKIDGTSTQSWANLEQRLCLVHDDVMSFLVEQATEVRTRIRLDDDSKTVAQGALWSEEMLPAESVLAALILAQPPKAAGLNGDQALDALLDKKAATIQLGGKASVGLGVCRLNMVRQGG